MLFPFFWTFVIFKLLYYFVFSTWVPPHGQLLVEKWTTRINGVLNVYGISPFSTASWYEKTSFTEGTPSLIIWSIYFWISVMTLSVFYIFPLYSTYGLSSKWYPLAVYH
jgi:hypothetical protein